MTIPSNSPNPWAAWWLSAYTGVIGAVAFWAGGLLSGGFYTVLAGGVVAVWILLFIVMLDSETRADGTGGWLNLSHIDKDDGTPYLRRLHLLPWNPHLNVYLHVFVGSDDQRGMHDHPFDSASLCLAGRMIEHMPNGAPADPDAGSVRRAVRPGSIRFRAAEHVHMLELVSKHAVTLFVTGPRIREWGFWIDNVWISSKELDPRRRS